MCVLAAQRKLPRPDHIVMADTGREVRSTHLYRDMVMGPYLRAHGLRVEVASHELATVDVHGKNGDLLLPVHTNTGQLPTFCSNEWKARVSERYLRQTYGYKASELINWIGFSFDERRRIKSHQSRIYPLAALVVRRADCVRIIQRAGLPVPRKSRCWCCPHQTPSEWRELPPDELAAAVALDAELRAEDIERGHAGVYLHRSRRPLMDAICDSGNEGEPMPCQSGMCFI
jgi:hypothetical protein